MLALAVTVDAGMLGEAAEGRAHDEAEFTAFFQSTARPLRAYLRRSLPDASVADDLLQEAYLRLLRAGFEAESEAHRRNYLFRIATNLIRDHYRRRGVATEELTETPGPDDHRRRTELRTDVGQALAELKPRDRQMLWLAYVEGFEHREIASALGLQTSSLKSMLFRARARLAAALRLRGLGRGETP